MAPQPTADEHAAELVEVGTPIPGGGFYVVLRTPGGDAVTLGPYLNRDVAKEDAGRVRRFVAAVIRRCRSAELAAAPASTP